MEPGPSLDQLNRRALSKEGNPLKERPCKERFLKGIAYNCRNPTITDLHDVQKHIEGPVLLSLYLLVTLPNQSNINQTSIKPSNR